MVRMTKQNWYITCSVDEMLKAYHRGDTVKSLSSRQAYKRINGQNCIYVEDGNYWDTYDYLSFTLEELSWNWLITFEEEIGEG